MKILILKDVPITDEHINEALNNHHMKWESVYYRDEHLVKAKQGNKRLTIQNSLKEE